MCLYIPLPARRRTLEDIANRGILIEETDQSLDQNCLPSYSGRTSLVLKVWYADDENWFGSRMLEGMPPLQVLGEYGLQTEVPELFIPRHVTRGLWVWVASGRWYV